MPESGQTLGATLRGARHGYRWVHAIKRYVMLRVDDDVLFRFHVVTAAEMTDGAIKCSHLQWWEFDHDLREQVLVLLGRGFDADRTNQWIWFNDDGEIVQT